MTDKQIPTENQKSASDGNEVHLKTVVEVTAVTADADLKAALDASQFEGEVLKIRAENELFGVRYVDPEGVEHVVQGPNKEWAESTYERLNGTNSGPEIVSSRVIYLDWQAI